MKRIVITFIVLLLILPHAAYAQPEKPRILIGLIPEMNIFKQKQRFKLLGEYLSRKTGLNIQFTILSRYGNIIDRFTTEKMDGAFFGSFTGALAIKKLGVIPLARPVNLDNTSTYQGYIFVRKESGINSIREMKGKKMAFVDRATTAGYIFPLAYMKKNGITDINSFFSEYFFTGSHDAAISAVLDKKADIGAAKHSMYERVRKDDRRVDRDLVIIARSPHVPSNGLCVRKDLDESLKIKLKDALLNINAELEGKKVLGEFGAVKFIETNPADYKPVFDLAAEAGIDLLNYKYRNE